MLFTTLFSLLAVSSAAAVDFTGYMVDAYCWNQPDHFADNTQTALDVMLLVSPEKVLAELDREEAAAAVIQRHVRGHHSRCVGHAL